MKEIPLGHYRKTKGTRVALVDDRDYPRVIQYRWHAFCVRGTWYAARHYRNANNKLCYMLLHRFILNPPSELVVDHVNGDGLDCQRQNMRICINPDNVRNSKISCNNTSGFKGVVYDKRRNNWIAQIQAFKKHHWLGSFDTPEQAAIAYNKAATKFFGCFARLNILPPKK